MSPVPSFLELRYVVFQAAPLSVIGWAVGRKMFLRCLQVTSQTSTKPPSKSFYKTLLGISRRCHKEVSVAWLAPSSK